MKPLIEELWRNGHQTMFYAEGNWDAHLDAFRELPDRSIVYHIDRGTPLLTHRTLHDKFALSGGVNNVTLALGTPEQVRQEVKTLIETVGREGGFIMDASAIMQNEHDAREHAGARRGDPRVRWLRCAGHPSRAAARRAGHDHHDGWRAGDDGTPAGRVRHGRSTGPSWPGRSREARSWRGVSGRRRTPAARCSSGRCWSRSDRTR